MKYVTAIDFVSTVSLNYCNVLKYWDTLKAINFPFVSNVKLIILGVPKFGHTTA